METIRERQERVVGDLEACLAKGVVSDLWVTHFGGETVMEDLTDAELERWQSIVIAEIAEAGGTE